MQPKVCVCFVSAGAIVNIMMQLSVGVCFVCAGAGFGAHHFGHCGAGG